MARAEDEKSLAGLLRHELRRRQPAEECPDAEALATYFEGAIEERERESLDRHFSDCARCRDALAVLARVGQEAVQQFAAAAAAAAPARAATSAPAQAVRELPRTPWWNWNWRLAVPLAALAILTVWMAREPAQVRTPVLSAENTTVASNANPAAGPPPVESVQNQQGLRSEPAGNLPDARSKIAATEKANRGPARENKPSRGAIGRMAAPSSAIESDASAEVRSGIADVAPGIATDKNQPSKKPSSGEPQPKEAEQVMVTQAAPALSVPAAPAPRPAGAPAAGFSGSGGMGASLKAAPARRGTSKSTVSGDVMAKSSLVETSQGEIIIRSPDPAILWRVTHAGLIERSFDVGGGWNEVGTAGGAEILTGSAPSVEVCWLVGRNGAVLRTTDGKNWQLVKFPEKVDLVSIVAEDAQIANVATREGRKFFTHDGGKTWQERK